ncbi:MAG: response regulator [Polyangiaceae bacterium]
MHDSVHPSERPGASQRPPTSGRGNADNELFVVGILADGDAAELLRRTIANTHDRVSIALDLAEGLTRVSAQAPDLAFVDVTLGGNAGLAVVHHIRALSPSTTVYAVTRSDRLELGLQAVALGSQGTLILPLSGDDVLNALGDVRRRRAEHEQRARLDASTARESAAAALCADLVELADAPSRRNAAERMCQAFAQRLMSRRVLVYLAASEASRQLVRVAVHGESSDEPSFCDELELLRYAKAHSLEVVRLALRREQLGLALVDGSAADSALLATASAAGTLGIAVAGAREQSSRGAMKDPESSAYTFAYFVDVAGREIDIARRHGRRFALATNRSRGRS